MPSKRDLALTTLFGFLGNALMSCLLFKAQETVSSVNAAMGETLAPILIFVFSALLIKSFSVIQFCGIMTGAVGCLLILRIVDLNGWHLSAYGSGDFLIFLSACCWALYSVLGRKNIARIGAYAFTAWGMFFASFAFLVFSKAEDADIIFPKTPAVVGAILIEPDIQPLFKRSKKATNSPDV